MVDIECSRCGAMGVNYPTVYVAKFTLVHRQGCGAKIGIPNYFIGKTKPAAEQTTSLPEPTETPKPKRKKSKKKKVEE